LKVVFHPPNTTSRVQPLDAGIISSMKVRYWRLQMERALDLCHEKFKKIYKVGVLTAMRWFKKVWEELPSSTIANCWRHIGLVLNGTESDDGAAANVVGEEREGLQLQVDTLVPLRCPMDIADLLNPAGEDDVFHNNDEEQLIANALDNGSGEWYGIGRGCESGRSVNSPSRN